MSRYGAGIECGMKFFSRRAWKRYPQNNIFRYRSFTNGFAFGPVIFWRK